ncbi:MAG TPA: TolC family protein [Coleofasciculaceae cyanobacterium]
MATLKQRDYLSFPTITIFVLKLLGILGAVLGTALTFALASKPQQAAKLATNPLLQSSIAQPTTSVTLPNYQRQDWSDRTQNLHIVPLVKARPSHFPVVSPKLKFRTNRSSPFQWTKKYPISCSPLQPTGTMSQEIKSNVTDLSVCSKRFSASGTEIPTTNLCCLSDIQIKSLADWERMSQHIDTVSKSSQSPYNQPELLSQIPEPQEAESKVQQRHLSYHSERSQTGALVKNSQRVASSTTTTSNQLLTNSKLSDDIPTHLTENGTFRQFIVQTNVAQPQPTPPSDIQELALTLSDVIILALENNRSLKNAYLERIAQRQDLTVAEDKFNPNLTPTVSVSIAQFGANPTITDSELGLGATVAVKIPTGGELSFSWATNGQPLVQNGVGINNNDDPFGQNLQLRFSQPLLRGAGININRASIEIARLTEQINILNLKSLLINTITESIIAYRELLRSQEQLKIAQVSLKSSKESLENYRVLIEAGRLAPVDIVQAQTDIANKEVRLIEAENNLASAQLTLLNILDIDQNTVIIPADSPQANNISLDTNNLRELAFKNQPDYLKAQLDIERTRLGLLQAENNRRWDLDLNTSYDYTLSDSKKNDARVGLSLSRELGDLTVERDFQRSRINNLQAENILEEQRESLEIQLKDRIRDVQLSFAQVELAQKATQLSEKQLEIAREKQKLGRDITVFELIRLEDDLVQARNVELNATIDYLNALTRLDQTLGTTLETWQVTIERK